MTDVFISYSRHDTEFARKIFDALSIAKRESWADWQGIDYSTKWWEEICTGIDGADNFVFLISSHALNSKYCHQEIEYARKKAKRIIPVLYESINQAEVIGQWYTNPEMKPFETLARENWEAIRTIQWIEYPKLGDLDKTIFALLRTVDTNPEPIRLHTRLTLRIREWEMSGRNLDLLLHGIELKTYEEWLSEYGKYIYQPTPTTEQRAYIMESRQVEDKIRQERESQTLFQALKGRALKIYVEPYLTTKLRELEQNIEQIETKSIYGWSDSKGANIKQELNTIKNFLEDGGKWHPQAPIYIKSLGARDDYSDIWQFPCCGISVVMGDGAPLQFRHDGCQNEPASSSEVK